MWGFGVSVTAWWCGLEDITFALTCQPLALHMPPVGSSTTVPIRSLAGWELHCLHSVPDPADGGLWWTPPFICCNSISIWGTPFLSKRQALNAVSEHKSSRPGFPSRLCYAVLSHSIISKQATLLQLPTENRNFFHVHLAIKAVCLPVYFVHHLHGQARYGSINSWS